MAGSGGELPLVAIYRLSEAELASETKNQSIERIELSTPSKSQVLTPKTVVTSPSGPTASYSGLNCVFPFADRPRTQDGRFWSFFWLSELNGPFGQLPSQPARPAGARAVYFQ